MFKKYLFISFLLFSANAVFSQTSTQDSLKNELANDLGMDTAGLDLDFLLDEFGAFLDSIARPKSYLLGGVNMSKGYYSFENKSSGTITSKQIVTYTPSVTFYHKSGFGINAGGNVIAENKKLNLYQAAISPTYDYLKNKKLATGFSYTRYFTKDSLSFYTTPLQNELYAYFSYRKWWIRPTVAVSYGWGSRTDYEERQIIIQDLQLKRRGYIQLKSEETINDFSVSTSVRHDFYWLKILFKKDFVRVTPQFTLTSGTQNFGFNQTANVYAKQRLTNSNVLYNSENSYLDDKITFQPLSLTFFLRTEYSIGKFYIQPQFILDYYFPASENNLSSLFSLNAGFIF